MPEHVHLLSNEPPLILVAQFLKAVKPITSRKLRGSLEKFWQERYIHRNPVKRGLVASPGDDQ
jgi:putative transposase